MTNAKKKFSLEDLSNYEPQPTVRTADLSQFFVGGYRYCSVERRAGRTILLGRSCNVILPNHLLASEIQTEIDRQVALQEDANNSAKDRTTGQNAERRFVLKFGSKF